MNGRHLEAVQSLEERATAVVLGALSDVLKHVTDVIGSVTTAAAAEPQISADDLSQIQTGWTVAVDGTVLPWYRDVFLSGAEAAGRQVAQTREIATEIIGDGDPSLLNEAATRHLATARNRFLMVGQDTWENARSQLLQGFVAGEGIEPLRERLQDVVDLSKARATAIARTEVISASNAGAITRVRAMGADAPKFKQWLATNDARTRPTHRAADNQVVPLTGKWTVGGTSLDYPGDPSGVDEEVINCRCSLIFVDSADGEPTGDDITPEVAALVAAAANVDSTTGEVHTGSMVALVPSDPEALVVHGGESAEQLHVTLWFLGEAADMPDELQAAVLANATAAATRLAPIEAKVFGAAVWNPTGEMPCLVLNVGGDGLDEAREAMGDAVERAAAETAPDWDAPANHTPWAAHMCVAYHNDPASLMADALATVGPMVLDTVRVTFGDVVHDFPLAGLQPAPGEATDGTKPGTETIIISETVQVTSTVDVDVTVDDLEGDMPYGIRRGGADCPFEVYNTETDERAPGGCHETRQEALDHQKALQVHVPDASAAEAMGRAVAEAVAAEINRRNVAAAGDCPPGSHLMPNGECMPDEDPAMLAAQPGEHFHAIMHTQGETTGFRTFNDLSWREPPFAFHWQRSSSAHGGLPETFQVGLIERVAADPANPQVLHAWGRLDLGGDLAREYARMLVSGFARWVSIGLDEMPTKETVIWPEDEMADSDDEDDPMPMLFEKPDQVIIDGGRIGELTSVSVPAQDNATVEPTPELVALMSDDGDQPSEPPAQVPAAVAAVEHVEPPMDPTQIEATVADVVQGITAAAHRIEIPHVPPRWWFEEPTDVDIAGALYVTDEGRIYGALAPLGVGHRAFVHSGRRQEVPFGNVDYSRYMGAVAITQAGRIPAGPVTMDCGHAAIHRDNHDQAPAHYDNACTVVAKICVGESKERGIVWAAGALEPSVTVDQVSRMLACRLSGDWQPHPDRAGWQELIAALLVPSPGFPMAHSGARLDYEEGVLVASSVPVRAVGAGGRPRLRVDVGARTVARIAPPTAKERIAAIIEKVTAP